MPAVALGGLIYVPGGFGNGQEEFAARALEAYDPLADTWHKLAPMPGGRHHAMAAGLDGLLYVFGGSCIPPCINGSDTVFVYDPAADAWEEKAAMPLGVRAGRPILPTRVLFTAGKNRNRPPFRRFRRSPPLRFKSRIF
jgi:N-acetylneuraminic acid mutarotase